MGEDNIKKLIITLFALALGAILVIIGVKLNIDYSNNEDKIGVQIEFAEEQVPAAIESDMGQIVETTVYNGEEIPTVEEVDGGLFEDKTTGVSTVEGDYNDLGWSEWYNTSSPEAFRNDTIGKCIIANNRYGAQCVSLARVFWWSYADRDVSTCGTGMAKGMMDCWEENAGDEFETFWGIAGVQAGDWVIWRTGRYGHIAMALGPQIGNYVTVLGENQGGRPCEGGGAATNIINLNVNGVIGYYRPKAYIKPAPTPEPTPTPAPEPAKTITYTYVKGDYFSKVLKKLGLDEGKLWGKNGTVHYYTQQLIEQDMLDKRGNVKIGKPFTLTRR